MIMSTTDVAEASLRVKAIASQFILRTNRCLGNEHLVVCAKHLFSFPHGLTKSIFLEDLPGLGSLQPLMERPGTRTAALQKRSALFEHRMHVRRNPPMTAVSTHRLRSGDGLRQDSNIRSARLYELRGLRDVLSEDELTLHLVVDFRRLQCRDGCATVRRMEGIGNRDLPDGRIHQRLHT